MGRAQEALGSMKRESRSVVNPRGELGSVEEDQRASRGRALDYVGGELGNTGERERALEDVRESYECYVGRWGRSREPWRKSGDVGER